METVEALSWYDEDKHRLRALRELEKRSRELRCDTTASPASSRSVRRMRPMVEWRQQQRRFLLDPFNDADGMSNPTDPSDDDDVRTPVTDELCDQVQCALQRALEDANVAGCIAESTQLRLGVWLTSFSVPPATRNLRLSRQRAYAQNTTDVTVTMETPVRLTSLSAPSSAPLLQCVGSRDGFLIDVDFLCRVSVVREPFVLLDRLPSVYSPVLKFFATWLAHHARCETYPSFSFDAESNYNASLRLSLWDHQFVAALRASSTRRRRGCFLQLACLSGTLGVRPLEALCCGLLAESGLVTERPSGAAAPPWSTPIRTAFRVTVLALLAEVSPNVKIVIEGAPADSVSKALASCSAKHAVLRGAPSNLTYVYSSDWSASAMSLFQAGLHPCFPSLFPLQLTLHLEDSDLKTHALNPMRQSIDSIGALSSHKSYFVASDVVCHVLLSMWASEADVCRMHLLDIAAPHDVDDDNAPDRDATVPMWLVEISTDDVAQRCRRHAAALECAPFRVVAERRVPLALALSVTVPESESSPDSAASLLYEALHRVMLTRPLLHSSISAEPKGDESTVYWVDGTSVYDTGIGVLKVAASPHSPCLIFEAAAALLRAHPQLAVMLLTPLSDYIDTRDKDVAFAWPVTSIGLPRWWRLVLKNVVQRMGHRSIDMDVLNASSDYCLVRFGSGSAEACFFTEAQHCVLQEFTSVIGPKLQKLVPRVGSHICEPLRAKAWQMRTPLVGIRSLHHRPNASCSEWISVDYGPWDDDLGHSGCLKIRFVKLVPDQQHEGGFVSQTFWLRDLEVQLPIDAPSTSTVLEPTCELTVSVAAAWYAESRLHDQAALTILNRSGGNPLDALAVVASRHCSAHPATRDSIHAAFEPGINATLLFIRAWSEKHPSGQETPSSPTVDVSLLHRRTTDRYVYMLQVTAGASHAEVRRFCTALLRFPSSHDTRDEVKHSTLEGESCPSVFVFLHDGRLPPAARRWAAQVRWNSPTVFEVPSIGNATFECDSPPPRHEDSWVVLGAKATRSDSAVGTARRLCAATDQEPHQATYTVEWVVPSDERLRTVFQPLLHEWQLKLVQAMV